MTGATRVRLRRLGVGDAALLAELGARLFRETFSEGHEQSDMDAYVASAFGEGIQREELSKPGSWVVVAEDESGSAMGYAHLAMSEGEPADPSAHGGADDRGERAAELVRCYVDRRWHGHGVAQTLMRACLAEAEARGIDVINLGVWQENARAIAFYRKFGFRRIGTQTFRLGTVIEHDWVMARPARPQSDDSDAA